MCLSPSRVSELIQQLLCLNFTHSTVAPLWILPTSSPRFSQVEPLSISWMSCLLPSSQTCVVTLAWNLLALTPTLKWGLGLLPCSYSTSPLLHPQRRTLDSQGPVVIVNLASPLMNKPCEADIHMIPSCHLKGQTQDLALSRNLENVGSTTGNSGDHTQPC